MTFFKRYLREIVALLLVGALFGSFYLEGHETEVDISDVVWLTYKNQRFGFSIDYPSTWQVAEFPDNEVVPTFNFYKPESTLGENPPYLNLSSVTHVSVYPRGVPVDESTGLTEQSKSMLGVPASQMVDFVLQNGSVWATKAVPTAAPPSWNRRGFVWSRLSVADFAMKCMLEEQSVEASFCKQNGQGHMVYTGIVDARDQAIVSKALSSFRFAN